MNIIIIILNSLTLVLYVMAFFYFKNYLPKYIEVKGANQATKEDIGEITEIVENIKSDLSIQGELIKAQLSFKNQHKLNLKSVERDAIIDYNKRLSAWLYSIMRFTFSSFQLENYKDLKSISEMFSSRQYESDLAEAHLVLFMNDQIFLDLKKDITISIIEIEGSVSV